MIKEETKKVIIEALEKDSSIIMYLNNEACSDEDIVLTAIKSDMDPNRTDNHSQLTNLPCYAYPILYASFNLINSKEFIMNARKYIKIETKYLSQRLQDDKDFVFLVTQMI